MENKETEIKFLVDEKFLKDILLQSNSSYSILQGYVRNSKGVRVRCVNDNGNLSSFITLKGKRDGITRAEFEYNIPYAEGESILENLCEYMILKTRYIIKEKKDKWEIDVFHGDNSGLIIAELEIPREDYDVEMPEWMSEWKPVTEDKRFYNHNLAKNPYKNWSKKDG